MCDALPLAVVLRIRNATSSLEWSSGYIGLIARETKVRAMVDDPMRLRSTGLPDEPFGCPTRAVRHSPRPGASLRLARLGMVRCGIFATL